MLDIAHSMIEDDLVPSWEHEAEYKNAMRVEFFKLYEEDYPAIESQHYGEIDYGESLDGSTKPYIPPTDPSEFENILGPPVG